MQDNLIPQAREHLLEIEEIHFSRLADGSRKCDMRYNSRDYQVGDLVRFEIIFHGKEAHREFVEERFRITHVLHYPKGLKEGWVVLSLELKKGIYED